MKLLFKYCCLISFLFITANVDICANTADLFDLNETEIVGIQTEMEDLKALENLVISNDLSYEAVENLHADYLQNLVLETNLESSLGNANLEPALNIPGVVWGMCFGFQGVAMVYFLTEDIEEVQKAFYGCLGRNLAIFVLYLVLVLNGAALTTP